MTVAEWVASVDPVPMIHWLSEQGYIEPLWNFTFICCGRIWQELPGDVFRRVVEHAEQVGVRDIDDLLAEASQEIDKLERRFRKATDGADQERLSRRIGFGRMVFAFENQDGAEAARSISADLLDWADDPEKERQTQVVLLRELVADPSLPAPHDEE